MSKTTAPKIDYLSQIKEIKKMRAYNVNGKTFEKSWKDGWVCYADLLAFSNDCKKSKLSPFNTIVRFRNRIENAKKHFDGNIYFFTDCCFFVSEELDQTLSFALCVMNGCCAMNKIALKTKSLAKAHHLLKPRITIAYGDYINESCIKEDTDSLFVDFPNLLTGSGIARAYDIEKESFSHAITINFSPPANKTKKNILPPKKAEDMFEVGGDNCLVKSGIKKWFSLFDEEITKAKKTGKEIVVHFPWPYINHLYEKNKKIHLVPNDNATFYKIEQNLFQTVERMQREFLDNNSIDFSAAKHTMALHFFAVDLYKNAKGAGDFTNELAKELKKKIAYKVL